MPNFNNRPISSGFRNTYKEQFVPLPLEIFARANESAQRTQDQYVDASEKASDELYKLRGIGDADNAKLKEYRTQFENTANELSNKDLTQLDNQQSAKKLIKGISRDKDLQTINYNYSQYQEYLKKRDALVDDNNYQAYNDAFLDEYQDYIKNGGYKSGKRLDPQIYKYMDTRPIKEEFFNNLGENGSDVIKQAGETYYKEGWKGISSGRIDQRAKQAFDSYLGTNAAQQEVREYNYLKKNGKVPKNQSAEEFVFKRFLDAGLERVHGISDSNKDTALNAERKRKKEEENLFLGDLTPETPSTLSNGRELKFNNNGQLVGSGQGIVDHFNKTGWSLDTLSNWWNDESLNSDEAKDWKYITTGAKLSGVTPQEYAKQYDNTSHIIVPKPLIGKALEDNTKILRSAGSGISSHLNIMDVKTGERGLNFRDALSKMAEQRGIDVPDRDEDPKKYDEFLDKMGVRVVGAAEPNEFSAKPVVFTLGDNTFVADMTFGGKKMSNASKADIEKSNYDKLQKGQQVVETEDGKDVIYYKDLKTGQIKRRLVSELKE